MIANPNEGRGSMTDKERTLERVRKLLAIAQDERADPNEAAAAAAMADKIMRKFQIEHADIIVAEMRAGGAAFDTGDVSVVMKRGLTGKAGQHKPLKTPPWAGWLAVRIAELHDCQARITHTIELGACIRFSGYKADVQVASWTFDYLANAMIQSTRRWQQLATRGKDESASYRSGFILALCTKLVVMKAEKDAEMQQASASRALVIVKTNAVAEHFGAVKYGKGKAVRTSRGDAYAAGREQGSKVNVGTRAVGHTGNDTKRLS